MESINHLLGYVWGGVVVLLVLTILVVVHEYGHFLAAKACRMKVDAFAVMMGGRRSAPSLDRLLPRPLASGWIVSAATIGAILALAIGGLANIQALYLTGLGAVAVAIPLWIGSRMAVLYHLPIERWLKTFFISWGAWAGILFLATRFKGINPEQGLIVMLAGSLVSLMVIYYTPVLHKPEDAPMGDGEVEVDGELVRVQFRPITSFRTKLGTEFSILTLPLGGFAAIHGMHPKNDGSEIHIEGGFYSKPPWMRLITLFAGPFFSIIFGLVLYVTFLVVYGQPIPDNRPIVSGVMSGKPADKAGLREKDRILAVNGRPVSTFYDVLSVVRDSKGTPVVILYERGGKKATTTLTPEFDGQSTLVLGPDLEPTGESRPQAKMGIPIGKARKAISFSAAVTEALKLPGEFVGGLATLVKNPSEAQDQLGGIGTVAKAGSEAAKQGFDSVLYLAAMLSISLGFMNLLPIFPLDGGQMAVAFVELLRRGRRLSMRTQGMVSTVGMMLVLLLTVFVMSADVRRFAAGEPKTIPIKRDQK